MNGRRLVSNDDAGDGEVGLDEIMMVRDRADATANHDRDFP